MAISTYEEIRAAVHRLPHEEQDQLLTDLQAARHDPATTSPVRGIVGIDFLALLDSLPPIEPADLDAMEHAIEEDCERIDDETWR